MSMLYASVTPSVTITCLTSQPNKRSMQNTFAEAKMLWHVPIQFKKEFKNKRDSNMWKKNLISLHEKMNLKVIGPKPIWTHFKNIFVFFTGCWCTLEWVEMSVCSIIYECKVCFNLFQHLYNTILFFIDEEKVHWNKEKFKNQRIKS